ncbi:MAG: 30S ribosomal protein S18 [Candidatus Margulisbacteria bacterium]|nr:30S ribosomal protein S18 [Candidatus Margulisiibacteriota bacterium]
MSRDKRDSGNNNNRQVKFRRIKRKPCAMCAANMEGIDYKDTNILKRNMTDRGKIGPRRLTGLCPKHQRSLARAIKKARIIGLVPTVLD